MRYFVATILFSLFLSLFLGTLADGDSPLITVEDALGRQVEVPSPAQRIVTVSAATHEFIRLLGCADRLVGAGQYVQGHASDLFPEVQRLPSVGHGFTPNMEILAKLRPDLIIAWAANPGPDLERSLAPLGVKVLRLNFSRTDTIKREVAVLAEALGQDARPLAQKYLTWVGGLEEELLAKVNQSPKRPSVLIEQLTEFAIAGQLSSAGVLAKTLGATNAGERFPGQFGSVSNEWILRQNPDYFIKMFAWRNQEDATKLLTM
ncbi:MAG: ABC transporter substrate-binding protein, partial [Deltaproteobacteria bacterium]|nr:ABC transporter substrate-binding protein [Deltaproteobacteria bacterium]